MEESEQSAPIPAIRLMIFDSTELGCQLLTHVLEGSAYGMKIVGHSTSSVVGTDSPVDNADVALISTDLDEGRGSGFRLLRELRRRNCPARCIMLLEESDREQVIEAFSCGALGVCGRHESCGTLSKCVDRVYQGQVWANSKQLRYVLETLWSGARVRLTDARGNALLTKREEEIVFLVAEGLRNKEIAEQLKLSEHTVRNYLFRVFEKLGISSRSELILYFIEQRKTAVYG